MAKTPQKDYVYAIVGGVAAVASFALSVAVSCLVYNREFKDALVILRTQSATLPTEWANIAFWISFVAVTVVPPLCKFTFAKSKWAVSGMSFVFCASFTGYYASNDNINCSISAFFAFAAALAIAALTARSWRMSKTPLSIVGTVLMHFALAHFVLWPTSVAVLSFTFLAEVEKSATIAIHVILYTIPIVLFALTQNFIGCFCLAVYAGVKIGQDLTVMFPFFDTISYVLLAFSLVGLAGALFLFIKQLLAKDEPDAPVLHENEVEVELPEAVPAKHFEATGAAPAGVEQDFI